MPVVLDLLDLKLLGFSEMSQIKKFDNIEVLSVLDG